MVPWAPALWRTGRLDRFVTLQQVHILQYALLGYLVSRVLDRGQWRWSGWAMGFLGLCGLGWAEELLQYVIPNRYFEWADVGWNALGSGLGVGVGWCAGRLWRRRVKPHTVVTDLST